MCRLFSYHAEGGAAGFCCKNIETYVEHVAEERVTSSGRTASTTNRRGLDDIAVPWLLRFRGSWGEAGFTVQRVTQTKPSHASYAWIRAGLASARSISEGLTRQGSRSSRSQSAFFFAMLLPFRKCSAVSSSFSSSSPSFASPWSRTWSSCSAKTLFVAFWVIRKIGTPFGTVCLELCREEESE